MAVCASRNLHCLIRFWRCNSLDAHRVNLYILKVDDKEVANKKIPHTIPFLMTIDETFDVGVDTRTPVDDKDYQVPFRFTGKIVCSGG